jgi:two-component system phosphate regulon response regulator PhoB
MSTSSASGLVASSTPNPGPASASARVLVVEDERDLATVLAYNFREAGFEVTTAETVADGIKQATTKRFDVVILDLMLPDGSGLDVVRALKAETATRGVPIVIASARGEEVDRIVGLELGVDDYVVKPFSNRELILRVKAILRRAEPATAPTDGAVSFGVLTIDRPATRVFVSGQEVQLTALEFRLLSTLHERKNRTQSRDTLLLDVWQMNTPVESRTVDTHVKRLREKLGAAAAYIRTVRGVGYRFASSPDEPGGDT